MRKQFLPQNELFTLVTDQGFLSKPNIVWETLSNVQGDTHFTDSSFRTTPFETNEEQLTEAQQIDQVCFCSYIFIKCLGLETAKTSLGQGSTIYGPRAGCSLPRLFTRPTTFYCHSARYLFSMIVKHQ